MEIRYTNEEVANIIEEYTLASLTHFITSGKEAKMESYYGQVTVKITPAVKEKAKVEQPPPEKF